MLKAMWREQKLPRELENNLIIYRKEEQTQCQNYRALCLAQKSYKLYTRILEKHLRIYMEERLEEEQAAFRPETQTNDNIYITKNLIEEEMFAVFINLKAAFDTINVREIRESLEEMEILRTVLDAIWGSKIQDTNCRAKIRRIPNERKVIV
ncbi:hypothetical protein Trydic_g7184 [Trypoxylus dichotomus]